MLRQAAQSAALQLKNLINRARASYQATRAEMDEDEASVQLELVQVESCVPHFVHLLAHHPALSSSAATKAVAEAGGGSAAPTAVKLKDVVKAGVDSPLAVWEASVSRQGLLKAMTAQMDFLLKALFEGQPNLQNAELINAMLRTIHEVGCSAAQRTHWMLHPVPCLFVCHWSPRSHACMCMCVSCVGMRALCA